MWFAESIDTYNQRSIENNQYLEYLDRNNDNPEMKNFLLSMLKHAEINIQDYKFESKTIENPTLPTTPGVMIDPTLLGSLKLQMSSKIYIVR